MRSFGVCILQILLIRKSNQEDSSACNMEFTQGKSFYFGKLDGNTSHQRLKYR
jgi:hypothetical protein